jgi:hypothetical protein
MESIMKTVKTNPSTLKTAGTPDKMAGWGNSGNTKGTRLPNGGCAKGSKKMGKRRKGY